MPFKVPLKVNVVFYYLIIWTLLLMNNEHIESLISLLNTYVKSSIKY